MQRIPDDQRSIPGKVYREGRTLGVTGTRGVAGRRIHAGFDASAWSKPTLIVYGPVTDKAAVQALAQGWTGAIEFQP